MSIEIVYEKHADILYRLALSHLNNQEDAEDAVQEAFIKYMHHIHLIKDEVHERAWLIRVTANICYDMLRHKNRRKYTVLEDVAESLAVEEKADIGIVHMLKKLPAKNKTVIVLYYLEGFSIDEISRMLHISVSAVKMRMSRGREQMKKIMEEEDCRV